MGRHEARELRDGEANRHKGLGVRKAVALVTTEITPSLRGHDLDDQEGLDTALIALDGTTDRSRLGANTLLAVSIATARAAAKSARVPLYVHLHQIWQRHLGGDESALPSLPLPMAHMISGTARVGRTLDFQDVMMIPVGARDLSEAMAMMIAVFHALGEILHKHGHPSHLVCTHGGYGPQLRSSAHAVDHLLEAVIHAGMEIARDVAVAIDVAATHVLDVSSGFYSLPLGGEAHDPSAMIAMLEHWTRQYPIVSIEDGLGDDDWAGWSALTTRLGPTTQLAGDDLFASRADRIGLGQEHGAANAVVIKPGQVGTLTETFQALALARSHGKRTIIAARAGETEDTTIADLAVATGAGQVKIGGIAPLRTNGQVQPSPPDRGGNGNQPPLRRPRGVRPLFLSATGHLIGQAKADWWSGSSPRKPFRLIMRKARGVDSKPGEQWGGRYRPYRAACCSRSKPV